MIKHSIRHCTRASYSQSRRPWRRYFLDPLPRSEPSKRRPLLSCCASSPRFSTSLTTPYDSKVDELDATTDSFLEHFRRDYYSAQKPVVLKNLVRHYPAVAKWQDLQYLEGAVGQDVPCDVEMGGPYNTSFEQDEGDDDAAKKLTVPFESYIAYLELWKEEYGELDEQEDLKEDTNNLPTEQLLYMAQNDFHGFGDQISRDIEIPSFCTDGTCGEGHLYNTNFWIGPRGCVSPMHYDPLDNILMQLVGRKRVTLLSTTIPNEGSGGNEEHEIDSKTVLYVGDDHGQQYNTSSIDIEKPHSIDTDKYPLFNQAIPHFKTALLHPGDALFIPSKYWHHVRSLTLSMSLNAWWR